MRGRAEANRATAGSKTDLRKSYDYARQTLTELPYGLVAEYDPEDTLRFYALRMHEVGIAQPNSPNQILAEGTDWRFLNELKRELKA